MGTELDDLPWGRTIPAKPVVGERFIQEDVIGYPKKKWNVFDWEQDVRGDLAPVELYCGLDEQDALLLVFGPALVEVCKRVEESYRDYMADDGSMYPDEVMSLLSSNFLNALDKFTES